jgi:hypothetical protein
MNEMTDIAGRVGDMTAAAERRFEAGRATLRRHRRPLGRAGLTDATKRLAELLPQWG